MNADPIQFFFFFALLKERNIEFIDITTKGN